MSQHRNDSLKLKTSAPKIIAENVEFSKGELAKKEGEVDFDELLRAARNTTKGDKEDIK